MQQLDLLPSSGAAFRERLAKRIADWTARGIYFGGSSWKYEGWLGQIYSRDLYTTRGHYAKERFEKECLREYAEVFPTVCGDFAFYQFYPAKFWDELFARVPSDFRFGFKSPEQITASSFADHDRHGARRGQANPDFLNANLLREKFLEPLLPYRSQVGYIVFEFPQFHRPHATFLDQLDHFLQGLPSEFRYAVEIRTQSLLSPAYFACLRRHGVSHVFNSWAHMPTIGEQLTLPDSMTADFVVVRALLRPGRTFEEAVNLFKPYREIRDPYPAGYRDVANVVRKAPKGGAFIAVGNRFAGNAPQSISEILNELSERDASQTQ